jgi:hypothetical protein
MELYLNMRKIPKTFQVFGKTFTVTTTQNGELRDWGAKGRCSEELGHIELEVDLTRASTEDIEITYLHEVVHIILDSISMRELAGDEQLVDLVARALHQFLISSEIWKDTPKPTRRKKK